VTPRARVVALVAVLGLVGASCAAATPWVASGQSLKVVGNTFVSTAAAFDAGLAAGSITPEQYRAWASFGRKFQAAWPLALDLWESSIKVNDAALQGKAEAILSTLMAELGGFAVQVGGTFTQADGGSAWTP